LRIGKEIAKSGRGDIDRSLLLEIEMQLTKIVVPIMHVEKIEENNGTNGWSDGSWERERKAESFLVAKANNCNNVFTRLRWGKCLWKMMFDH
jgi:hypothetical protein